MIHFTEDHYLSGCPAPDHEYEDDAHWEPALGVAVRATRDAGHVVIDTGDTRVDVDIADVNRVISALRAAHSYATKR